MDEEKKGMDRRQFIRRAAVTTAAAAWAAPVIQTVTASPAFAGTPEECDHSGCIGACAGTAGRKELRRPSARRGVPGPLRRAVRLWRGRSDLPGSTTAACVSSNWFHCVFTG